MTDRTQSGLSLQLSRSLLAFTCGMLAVLAFVDGFLPQLQMELTGGHVFVPMAVVKLSLFAMLCVAMVLQWRTGVPTEFLLLWSFFLLYLLVDAVFLLTLHVSVGDLVIGTNAYYGYFLMVPFAFCLFRALPAAALTRMLVTTFAGCVVVGTAQFLSGRPLLYTESLDGSFAALSWSLDGGVRAFSLFSSGLGYGTFCCLVGALSGAQIFERRHKLRWATLFLLSGWGCYTTLTRNCYTQFGFAAVMVMCLAKRRPRAWVRYLPVVFLLVSVAIAFVGAAMDSSSDSAVTSNLSTLIRVAEWQYYLTLYQNAPVLQKLFGLGLLQNGNASNESLFAIDNQYLLALMHIGLCGTVLLFWIQWRMWLWLYNRAVTARSALTVALAAFWSTFLAVYVFNGMLATFSLVFILGAMFSIDGTPAGNAADLSADGEVQPQITAAPPADDLVTFLHFGTERHTVAEGKTVF